MTQHDVDDKYKDLISSYLEIKPVLTDLYIRNGNRHVDAILNEVRAISDHVARCYRNGITANASYNELCKAEGHLKRLIYDCFKQLNILFYDYVTGYEALYFGSHWLCLDEGQFWNQYVSKRNSITFNVEQAKKSESIDSEAAFEYYQNAYVLQGEVYALMEGNKDCLQLSWWERNWRKLNSMRGWLFSTVALAVIPALIWEVYTHWSLIVAYGKGILISLVHELGEFFITL